MPVLLKPCVLPEVGSLDIGLINNMPDGAMQTTERQFLGLLAEAAGRVMVRVWLYALPGIPRSGCIQRHITARYCDIDDLWQRRLDGLIVTGTEPRASHLTEEPYWQVLTQVIDWAEHNTASTIWSCLAAHAAILHIDGIHRRRLNTKRSGVFEYACRSDHPFTQGIPQRVLIPHSRWNDIPENELASSGYRVLTRGDNQDVDMFVKQRKSSFLFFQGHPEYETNTLLREYRRDINRYLGGETETYPGIPQSYFTALTVDGLNTIRERTLSSRRQAPLGDFPTALIEEGLVNKWSRAANRIYSNWLVYLCQQKKLRLNSKPNRMERALEGANRQVR